MPDDACQQCGPAEERPELLWTEDGSALCMLCAIELVFCDCGAAVRRYELLFTAAGDVCPACAFAGPAYTVALAA